jgi:CRISPR-associated protein Csm2
MSNGRSEEQGRGRDSSSQPASEKIKKRIDDLKGGFGNYPMIDLVEDAEALAMYLRSVELKSTQIRRLYGTVKKLQMEFTNPDKFDLDRIIGLRPKFAYAANKSKKNEVQTLQRILDSCIQKISNDKDFARFVDFFEAILAYHR